MSTKLPSKKVRQLGPDIWTFDGYPDDIPVDVGTEWVVIADGEGSGIFVTRIAGR